MGLAPLLSWLVSDKEDIGTPSAEGPSQIVVGTLVAAALMPRIMASLSFKLSPAPSFQNLGEI